VTDHDCTQEENIRDIKISLKDLVTEFRTEFRGVMAELTIALKDGREYRTRIKANDDAIKMLREADLEQWGKISDAGKRTDALELWRAREEGARRVLSYLPTFITFILTVIVLWDKIK